MAHHQLQHRPGHIVKAVQTGIDDRLPLFRRHHHEQPVGNDPGVVDQDVDTSQPGADFRHNLFRCLSVPDIKLADLALAALPFNHGQGLLCALLVAVVVDDQIIASPRQLHADCPADPLAAPGDQGYAFFVFCGHCWFT